MPFALSCVDAGYKSLRDIPEIEVDQRTVGELEFTLRDPKTGAPIDLTEYGISNASENLVQVIIKEMYNAATIAAEPEINIVDADNGKINLVYARNDTRRAGIFIGEFRISDADTVRRVIPFYYIVNPSLAGSVNDTRQALSIAEIRMTLRDSDPLLNNLIDELDFKTNEIALMIRRCVDYWNEVPPSIGTYTPATFPWRYHLSIGVASMLHEMAAVHKMRNEQDYSSGGITYKDMNTTNRYQEKARELWQQWAGWVKDKKYQINVERSFMIQSSGYTRTVNYR